MEGVKKYVWRWVWLSMMMSPALVRAKAANSSGSAELIRALLSRVEQLQKRVAELEGRWGAPGPATPPAITAAQHARAPPAPQAAETAAADPAPITPTRQVHMSQDGGMPART